MEERVHPVKRGILCNSFVDLYGLHWAMNGLEYALNLRLFQITGANADTPRQLMQEHCPLSQAHGLLA